MFSYVKEVDYIHVSLVGFFIIIQNLIYGT